MEHATVLSLVKFDYFFKQKRIKNYGIYPEIRNAVTKIHNTIVNIHRHIGTFSSASVSGMYFSPTLAETMARGNRLFHRLSRVV